VLGSGGIIADGSKVLSLLPRNWPKH